MQVEQLNILKVRLKFENGNYLVVCIMNDWYIYIVRCSDDSLYTGITKDIDRRIDEHNNGSKGAAYTRSHRPVKLVYQESCNDRSEATVRESEIKKLSKKEKELMIKKSVN